MIEYLLLTMPPRTSFTSSFSISNLNNEVVCPLHNQDGSGCRKRCLGEKRYRSMQEHIRRAHPENYIPKLPATEESFRLMITTLPSERPQSLNKPELSPKRISNPSYTNDLSDEKIIVLCNERKTHSRDFSSSPNTPVNTPKDLEEHQTKSNSSTAAALTKFQSNSLEPESELERGWSSDIEVQKQGMRHSIEFSTPKIGTYDTRSDSFSPLSQRGEILPSILSTPQFERSSTLPPIRRIHTVNRPRKESISKRAREPQHKKNNPKGENAHLWRINFDRKAQSTEISSGLSGAWGKRWEDLIDAATSATKDAYEISHLRSTPAVESIIKEPIENKAIPLNSLNRDSLPVFTATHSYYERYQASPLQQTLTPPSNSRDIPDTIKFMVNDETSKEIKFEKNSHSSLELSSRSIQIYCAACHSLSFLGQSYVCTECICGICETCVDALMTNYGARRKCPKCATIGGRYKKINLDIRT
ncbi:putative RfeD protein [Erysiphe neolycopersici]|uniref:Putative RfeD protein n=1 Tax=Erysiphe neolycopersici TaxID=212602 RepID=A0A420HPM5_9PEZI|nr:putative RfeD protein [Erysiphe neolycopersici]